MDWFSLKNLISKCLGRAPEGGAAYIYTETEDRMECGSVIWYQAPSLRIEKALKIHFLPVNAINSKVTWYRLLPVWNFLFMKRKIKLTSTVWKRLPLKSIFPKCENLIESYLKPKEKVVGAESRANIAAYDAKQKVCNSKTKHLPATHCGG